MSRHKNTATLDSRFKRVLYSISLLLWGSGAVFFFLSEGHPAGAWLLKLHGAAAMICLVLLGMLLAKHVPAGWRQDNRWLGGALLGMASAMTMTGWFLYYIGTESIRHVASLIHSVVGLLSPLVLVAHVRWRSKNPPARPHGHSNT